jgi:hypothetical protein
MKYRISTPLRFVLLYLLFGFPAPQSLSAQNLLYRPESVVYDSLYNRYLVSNWGNGSIVQIDSNGVQSYFTTGHGSINGIYITENKVFAGCSTKVKGFNLSDTQMVMDVLIPGAINLNDVTADNSGNLYITDFTARKIMKVNIQSHRYSTFVSGLTLQPNGILFDEPNNRLLICSFGYNIPILAISLEDSPVSIVAYTYLAQCDGFAKDDYGNYYISSWETKSIYKFDSVFSNPPEVFYTNSDAPADISYNSVDDLVVAPILWQDKVVYLLVNPALVRSERGYIQQFNLLQNYPNPFNPYTTISYQIPTKCHVSLKIYDVLGNEITTLVNDIQEPDFYEVNYNGTELSSGVYFYQILAGKYSETKKMMLLK